VEAGAMGTGPTSGLESFSSSSLDSSITTSGAAGADWVEAWLKVPVRQLH